MEWTKIKVKHFLFSNLRKSMKGDLIDLLCLTAQLEHMPTHKQMRQVCTETALKSLRNQLETNSVSLELVLKKVLEDVEIVNHRKELSRATSKRYYKSHKNSDTSYDTSPDVTEDNKRIIREDIKEKSTKSIFKKPTLKEISVFINEGCYKVCGETFFDHYEANGWMVGKAKMKDWKATIRNWHRRNKGEVKKERPKV